MEHIVFRIIPVKLYRRTKYGTVIGRTRVHVIVKYDTSYRNAEYDTAIMTVIYIL